MTGKKHETVETQFSPLELVLRQEEEERRLESEKQIKIREAAYFSLNYAMHDYRCATGESEDDERRTILLAEYLLFRLTMRLEQFGCCEAEVTLRQGDITYTYPLYSFLSEITQMPEENE